MDTNNNEGRDNEPMPPFAKEDLSPPGIEENMVLKPRFEGPRYKSAKKLEGKVALITGGDSGIGRSVAFLFAREGANVAFTHLPEEKVDASVTIERIEHEGSKALSMQGDITSYAFCKKSVETCIEKFKKLDILVNNAAYQRHLDSIGDLTIEQWDKTFKTNIYSYFYFTKAALEFMQPGSCIINTSSITGLQGSGHLVDYSATKGAINAFTKSLAQQLVKRRIRVNCVAPGPVWTPLNPAERGEDEIKRFGAETPLGRPAEPEEIAPAYVYFASEADSSYVTGEILTLLGGTTRAA